MVLVWFINALFLAAASMAFKLPAGLNDGVYVVSIDDNGNEVPPHTVCSKSSPSMTPKANRTYKALSYAWGDPAVTAPVWLNGIEKQVTVNLAAALRREHLAPFLCIVSVAFEFLFLTSR